jgi:hypothetical protein
MTPQEENELCLLWLGWEKASAFPLWRFMKADGFYRSLEVVPNFRIDNEWAGALLEKLQTEAHFDLRSYRTAGVNWVMYGTGSGTAKNWRDAVCNAVLKIVKRELK